MIFWNICSSSSSDSNHFESTNRQMDFSIFPWQPSLSYPLPCLTSKLISDLFLLCSLFLGHHNTNLLHHILSCPLSFIKNMIISMMSFILVCYVHLFLSIKLISSFSIISEWLSLFSCYFLNFYISHSYAIFYLHITHYNFNPIYIYIYKFECRI